MHLCLTCCSLITFYQNSLQLHFHNILKFTNCFPLSSVTIFRCSSILMSSYNIFPFKQWNRSWMTFQIIWYVACMLSVLQTTCIIVLRNIYLTCHAKNVATGITSFTMMFVFACKSYKFLTPNYLNLTNNFILTRNNHTK